MAFFRNYFLHFTIAFLISGFVTGEHCKKKLGNLANTQQLFVFCTVENSTPKANSCVKCYNEHEDMINSYKSLTEDCSDELLNKNRLNIVYNMQNTLVEIWNKQFCDDCHGNNSTEKFNNLKSKFDDCVGTNITTACKTCVGQYADLNKFYKEMEEIKSGKICFDSQDAMNATRLQWSKQLKCCSREINPALFLVASSILTALPLIFYIGMYAYTKRVERNHEVIDSNFQSRNAGPSTSAGISPAAPVVPSTSSGESETTSAASVDKKIKQHIDLTMGERSSTQENAHDLIKLN